MNNSAMPIYYMRHERNSGAAAQRLRENEEHGRQSPRRDSSPRRRISEKTIWQQAISHAFKLLPIRNDRNKVD
jgi:hypothetical protein